MYSDDSGNSSPRDGKYYVISGIIVDEPNYDYVVRRILEYRNQNFIDLYIDAEIHVHDIWQNKEEFEGVYVLKKLSLVHKLYRLIAELPITLVAVGVNKPLMVKESPNWTVFGAAWTFLTERFNNYVMDEGDVLKKGMMFIDESSKMPDAEIKAIVNRLRRKGSNYQNFPYIHEDPLFVTSHERPLLQIADAVAYCILKQLCGNRSFNPYWLMLKNKFRRSPSGEILGWGLKIFPRRSNEAI